MSEPQRVCRRCLLLQSGKENIIDDIRQRIEKIPANEKTADEIRRERLDTCSVCDFLENGTCLKCGCYPEWRASFAKNRCPAGKWKA